MLILVAIAPAAGPSSPGARPTARAETAGSFASLVGEFVDEPGPTGGSGSTPALEAISTAPIGSEGAAEQPGASTDEAAAALLTALVAQGFAPPPPPEQTPRACADPYAVGESLNEEPDRQAAAATPEAQPAGLTASAAPPLGEVPVATPSASGTWPVDSGLAASAAPPPGAVPVTTPSASGTWLVDSGLSVHVASEPPRGSAITEPHAGISASVPAPPLTGAGLPTRIASTDGAGTAGEAATVPWSTATPGSGGLQTSVWAAVTARAAEPPAANQAWVPVEPRTVTAELASVTLPTAPEGSEAPATSQTKSLVEEGPPAGLATPQDARLAQQGQPFASSSPTRAAALDGLSDGPSPAPVPPDAAGSQGVDVRRPPIGKSLGRAKPVDPAAVSPGPPPSPRPAVGVVAQGRVDSEPAPAGPAADSVPVGPAGATGSPEGARRGKAGEGNPASPRAGDIAAFARHFEIPDTAGATVRASVMRSGLVPAEPEPGAQVAARTASTQGALPGAAAGASVPVGASLPFDEVIALAASEPRRAHAAASPDVPGQIVRAIAMHWRQGVGEARVQLHPEHLGEVTVALRVEQGSVVAHVRAESAAAVELIRTRQQELHSALEEQGLNLDRLVIDLDTDERRERPAYRQPDPPRPGRRGAGTATFEVIV